MHASRPNASLCCIDRRVVNAMVRQRGDRCVPAIPSLEGFGLSAQVEGEGKENGKDDKTSDRTNDYGHFIFANLWL